MIAFRAVFTQPHTNWYIGDGAPPPGYYNLLTFDDLEYNEGNRFQANKYEFIPVAEGEEPREVSFDGQLWISQNALNETSVGVPSFVGKVYKNWGRTGFTQFSAGIGVPGYFQNSCVIPLRGRDIAQPGDRYSLWMFSTYRAAILDPNPAHSYWAGSLNGG